MKVYKTIRSVSVGQSEVQIERENLCSFFCGDPGIVDVVAHLLVGMQCVADGIGQTGRGHW